MFKAVLPDRFIFFFLKQLFNVLHYIVYKNPFGFFSLGKALLDKPYLFLSYTFLKQSV